MTDDHSLRPDSATVDQLLAEDRERLITTAHRIMRDRHEAEDVVQETLAAVLKRLPDIPACKLTNYLNRSVRQNAIKKKSRRRDVPLQIHDAQTLVECDASHPVDPIDLEEALSALPMAQQSVLRMKYYFGMTFVQIAQSLSISTNTAASRSRYALRKLSKALSQERQESSHEQED
ncbi:MAG: sigma-70 family RNA polymerase sigma factor [Planctomycetota bacterium]